MRTNASLSAANRDAFLKLQEEGYVRYDDLPLRARDGRLVSVEFVSNVYAVNSQQVIQCNIRDISTRKKVEESLKESRQFLKGCLDALSENIAVIDETGRIIAVNQRWRDFARSNGAVEAAVCEGANYLAVCDAAHGESAEGAQAFAEAIRGIFSGRMSEFAMEYSCHSPEEQRWFTGRLSTFTGNGPRRVVASHENITERKQAADALRESEARFRALVESAPDAIFVQSDGRFVYLNPAMLRLLGASRPEDLIGTDFLKRVAPEYHQAIHDRIRQRLETGTPSPTVGMEYLRVDGSRVRSRPRPWPSVSRIAMRIWSLLAMSALAGSLRSNCFNLRRWKPSGSWRGA